MLHTTIAIAHVPAYELMLRPVTAEEATNATPDQCLNRTSVHTITYHF